MIYLDNDEVKINKNKEDEINEESLKSILISSIICSVFILTPTQNVYASRNIQVLLEGQEVLFGVAPQIIEGDIMRTCRNRTSNGTSNRTS